VELEGLRRRFLEDGMLQTRQMLDDVQIPSDVSRTAALMHRWIGTAGVLGYVAISKAARTASELIASGQADTEQLRASLTDLIFAFSEPREADPSPLPEFIGQMLSGKSLALVGFAVAEGERLFAVLERAGARPRLFDASDTSQSLDCNAILFNVRPETLRSAWISSEPPVHSAPLILVGRRESIMALDRSVQSRSIEFLIDVWQPEEALMRLSFALARATSQTAASRPRETPQS
jgi:hypothetical protein